MYTQRDVKLTEKQDFMLYLIPTYDCNLRCTYCFVPKDGGYKIDSESLESVATFINTRIDSKKILIGILGGEPFFYKDLLIETIKYLDSHVENENFSFYISTNGILINEEILQRVKDTGANVELAFSIDGNPNTININRTKKKDMNLAEIVVKNFLAAKTILGREYVSITQTISLETVQYFEENLKFLFELNPYLLRFRLAAGEAWNKEKMDEYMTHFKRLYLYYVDILYIKDDISAIPMVEQFEYMIDIKKDNLGACSKGVNLTLTPDGFFVPCYNFLTKEKQDIAKFPVNINDLVKTSEHDEEFLQWRADYYSHNNGLTDENGKIKEGRYNFSTCIKGDHEGEAKERILNIWKYKEDEEKLIGLKVFNFIYKAHGINLYDKSLVYNKPG